MDLIKRLFGLSPAREPKPVDELAQMVTAAFALLDQVPDPKASQKEIKQAVPYQNILVLDLVSQVILGMETGGADFADYPEGPAALREQDLRAGHWQMLANLFTELARCARVHALLEQATLARSAIQVLRFTTAGARQARPDALDRRRAARMSMAYRALAAVFGRRKRKR